jgi:hypothetical protein
MRVVLTFPGVALVPPLLAVLVFQARVTSWLRNSFLSLLWLVASILRLTYESAIQLPLRDLYRNGPWIVGWEGDRLERVCSRITYHGDEAFWSRNSEECYRIYAAKEEAYLRLAGPLAFLALSAAAIALAGKVWLLVRPARRRLSPSERDAVETYRALQVLLRQAKKNA